MSKLVTVFNPTEVEPSQGVPEPFPEGWYPLIIYQSKAQNNSSNTGQVAYFYCKVTEGMYKGRKLLHTLNVTHKTSKQAQDIGQKELSALCHAIGYLSELEDTDELLDQPFVAFVGIEPSSGKDKNGKPYPPKNVIKRCIAPDDFKKMIDTGEINLEEGPPWLPNPRGGAAANGQGPGEGTGINPAQQAAANEDIRQEAAKSYPWQR
ncbi:MAG: DUF669 domain-containing protein [bacterium]